MQRRYRKRPSQFVVAVQLAIDTPGFSYRKWGAEQRCTANDWLVENQGEVYTVDEEVFAKTYREVERGRYIKTTPVWAERATEAGAVKTKEGQSRYEKGDYLVFNNEDGTDAYCVSAAKFEAMYEPEEEPLQQT